MKRSLSLLSIIALLLCPITVHAYENESALKSEAKVIICGNNEQYEVSIPVKNTIQTNNYTRSGEPIYESAASAIIEIDRQTNKCKYIPEENFIMPLDTQSTYGYKDYWQATVTLKYTLTNSYIEYISASVCWEPLSINAPTISERKFVYGGAIDGLPLVEKHPTTNSDTYETYFGRRKYGHGGLIFGSATCTISGQSFTVDCVINL